MRHFFSNKTAYIIFFVMISVQMLCYNYIDYIQMEPRSLHSWRQSDCLSFALNFYNGQTTFAAPGVNNLGITGDGKIASDFPIIQYLVAQIWMVTGVSTPIFRLFDLFFLVVGLLYIYKLYCYWFKDKNWLALVMTGIIFTSTILAYYGPTSLSDIQALGLSCAAFYYFILWLDKKKKLDLGIALFLFAFAGLLKMSSAFIFAIALSYLLVRILFGNKEDKKGLLTFYTFVVLLLPFLPWIAWYSHVHHYNQVHPNEFFLIGILPIWKLTHDQINYTIARLLGELMPFALNIAVLFVLFIALGAWFLTGIKSFFTETYLRLLLPLLAFLSYIILFFEVFTVHDYYLLNMMPILVIVLGLLIKYILEHQNSFFDHAAVQVSLVLLLILLTHQTGVITRGRIELKDWGYAPVAMTAEKYDFLKWNSYYDRSRYEVIEIIKEEELAGLGIGKSQKVMCLGDHTINRSLYLIDRLGYTSFNVNIDKAEEFIRTRKSQGLIDYLILIEPDWLSKESLVPFLKNKVYEKGGTSIYKL